MPQDTLQFNSRERALSSDLNDAQAMTTRQLTTLLRFLLSTRAPTFLAGSSGQNTFARNGTLGLVVEPAGGGASVLIRPGVLADFSTTWPAAPGALESGYRVGFNRTDLVVAHPGAPLTNYLVEARVTDVDTVTSIRDIFDVPTQTFLPVLVTKQKERRIELQFVGAPIAAALPTFSGSPWVPLRYITTDGAGLWNGLAVGVPDFDVRPDMRDMLEDDGGVNLGATLGPVEAKVESFSLSTVRSAAPGVVMYGAVRARAGELRGHVLAAGALGVAPTDVSNGYARVGGTLAHLYLVPMKKNGVEVMPTIKLAPITGSLKGLLIESDVPPHHQGHHASAPITLNAGGPFAGFDVVPAQKAIHIASVLPADAANYYWFSQTRHGEHRYQAQPDGQVFSNAVVTAVPLTFALDFRSRLPPNARVAIVSVQVAFVTPLTGGYFEIRPIGGAFPTDNFPPVFQDAAQIDAAAGVFRATKVFELPIGFDPTVDTDQRYEIQITPTGGPAGNTTINVHVLGWKF